MKLWDYANMLDILKDVPLKHLTRAGWLPPLRTECCMSKNRGFKCKFHFQKPMYSKGSLTISCACGHLLANPNF